MIPSRSRSGMENSLGEKSPTVKLAILCPACCLRRISEAILRISEPIRPRAMVERPRRGSGPSRSRCNFSTQAPLSVPPKFGRGDLPHFPLHSRGVRLKALVWIVRPGAGGRLEALLLERPERRGGGEHPVTGKADAGEAPLACAEREALEETGLRGDLVELGLVHRYRGAKGDFEEHAFLLRVGKRDEPVLSSEHVGFRWATPEEAREAMHWKAHREALDAALAHY